MKSVSIGDWTIQFSRASHKWSHFKIHDQNVYKHLVWGKISIIYGRPGLEELEVCPHCKAEAQELGDLTYCTEGCGCIEDVGSMTITMDEWENL